MTGGHQTRTDSDDGDLAAAAVGLCAQMSPTEARYLHPDVVAAYRRHLRAWFGGTDPCRDRLVLDSLFRASRAGADLAVIDVYQLWASTGTPSPGELRRDGWRRSSDR